MYTHSPLLDSIICNQNKYPDKIAIIINGAEITYKELVSNIHKAASILLSHNIKARDRIILTADKNVEFIYLYFGAHIIGVTNTIIDTKTNVDRLHYIEDQIKPIHCYGYVSDKFPSTLYSDLNLNFNSISEYNEINENLSVNDIAEILFTTGTTGNPKGVCLSHYNIFSSATNINHYIQNNHTDIELLGLPICHSFGLGRVRCNLITGATIVILNSFTNVRAFLDAFSKYNITGFGVVPSAWAYIRKMSGTRIQKYAHQIKYIEIGSATMPIETKKEMLTLFPNTRICMHYGLTEASRNSFIEFHDLEHLSSIGKPVCNDVVIKICDSLGNELPHNSEGEICVKGNMVMKHYLNQEDCKDTFWGEYFRTGDYGYMNDDKYIYLLGREKEMINVGGKKVSPLEVEEAIISLGVGDCICVAVHDNNNIMGELVKCYILKDSTTLSFDEIASRLTSKLELYKRPVEYDWIDKIPTTSSGKKKRLIAK